MRSRAGSLKLEKWALTAIVLLSGINVFAQNAMKEDNPTAGVVYQVLVHERASSRLVFETVNVTPVKARLLVFRAEVAAPGEYRQLYYIERERDDVWRYYGLVRMGGAGSLAGTSAANYHNRAEAYFRYLAGLRMDREPPAAR